MDLCNLAQIDDFKHLIVCIDYFSKWSEAKTTATSFLYEIICRHGCIKTQINDQGKEFVNQVAESLYKMARTEQRIALAYPPKSTGLCEQQNRTIKGSAMKVLEEFSLIQQDIRRGNF